MAKLSPRQTEPIAKALAEPRRVDLLRQIGKCPAGGGASCVALREGQDVTLATLSHHLKELEMAGLVDAPRKGRFMHRPAVSGDAGGRIEELACPV